MNKKQLISQCAEQSDLKKSQVEAVLDALASVFSQQLTTQKELVIPGIGKFKVKNHAERPGRNPQTGAEITIPAKNVVKFLADIDVREAVNGQ